MVHWAYGPISDKTIRPPSCAQQAWYGLNSASHLAMPCGRLLRSDVRDPMLGLRQEMRSKAARRVWALFAAIQSKLDSFMIGLFGSVHFS